MNQHAECRRVRELMDSYISGELAVESNHELLAHLDRCESCRGEVERRQRMRVLLRESFGTEPDASAVTARVARAIDHDQSVWRRVTRYGSIAAALALAVGAALWLSRPVDAAAFDDSVDNHIICALSYPPTVTYDAGRVRNMIDAAYQGVVDAVSHRLGDYELIDGHMCPYQGRNYVHLVYRHGEHKVSVFAEPATRGRLPLTHEAPRKGYVSEGASAGGHQVFVVSENGAGADDVVRELLRSTIAFARTVGR